MTNLIVTELNSIQYFTVEATGESGMSISGLARCAGVSKQAISNLIQGLSIKSPSAILDSFTGMSLEDLTLSTNSSYHNVTVLKDTLCAAILTHYAQAGRIESAISLGAFAAVGIRVYIQSITGWKQLETNNQPKLPTTYLEALKALVEATEEKEQLALQAAELNSKVAVLEPKASTFDKIANSGNYIDMANVAKTLNVKNLGRNNLFQLLRNQGILNSSNIPYQRFMKHFVVVQKVHSNQTYSTTHLNPDSWDWMISQVEKAGYIVPSKVAA